MRGAHLLTSPPHPTSSPPNTGHTSQSLPILNLTNLKTTDQIHKTHNIQIITTMEEKEDSVTDLPVKSRSLRKTSQKKRLETELKKVKTKGKGKISKKPRLNKYQRKMANAKERERMKRMNDVFDRLKSVLPLENFIDEDGKDTKVS